MSNHYVFAINILYVCKSTTGANPCVERCLSVVTCHLSLVRQFFVVFSGCGFFYLLIQSAVGDGFVVGCWDFDTALRINITAVHREKRLRER